MRTLFFAFLALSGCGTRERQFISDEVQFTIPAAGQCSSYYESGTPVPLAATLRSRRGEQVAYVRCEWSQKDLVIGVFRSEYGPDTPLEVRLREDVGETGGYTRPPEHGKFTFAGVEALREEAEILYAGLPQKRIVVLARDGDILRGAAVMGTPSAIDKHEARIDAWLASVEFAR